MKTLLTFSRAIVRLVVALFTRRPVFVTPEQCETRIHSCETLCQHFDQVDRKCRVCKCFVDAKAPLATEDCPKRIWPDLGDTLA